MSGEEEEEEEEEDDDEEDEDGINEFARAKEGGGRREIADMIASF